ncbi:MAG: Hsp70 family protein [Tepidisphaerales bacterium]
MSQHDELILPEDRPGLVKRNRPFYALGIDLGTTQSTVSLAVWDGVNPVDIRTLPVRQRLPDGEHTDVFVPSVVAIHGGRAYVGEGGRRLRGRATELGLRQYRNLFYDTKNEIGLKKTYAAAPDGFRCAAEIGARVLKRLYRAAEKALGGPPDRVVVTVPASFQAAQRNDTLRAAELAGIRLGPGDLLDEPVAAFIAFVANDGDRLVSRLSSPRNLVVFDFGGGTCDVAVLRLHRSRGVGPVRVSWLAVSRYHRLGGGDIDNAIVHEVLIPQLLKENGMRPFDLTYDDKRFAIEPVLLGVAERLKQAVCERVGGPAPGAASGSSWGGTAKATADGAVVEGVFRWTLRNRDVRLTDPTLSVKAFNSVLKPFLDRDLLYARETEYRVTSSIFAPLGDALDRAGITPEAVDECLVVGGSSRIPQVMRALRTYFPRANFLSHDDAREAKLCVSKGAAYHAVSLAAFGRGLVVPVAHEDIAIRTTSGLVTLVPTGTALPHPGDGSWAETTQIAVPETVLTGVGKVRMEVVAGGNGRVLYTQVWRIPAPVNRGSPIEVSYRLDENQVLHLRARLLERPEAGELSFTIENPLTHVVNPQPKRLRIEELEESVRLGEVTADKLPEVMIELAQLYDELGQREKAVEYLQRTLRELGRPDAGLLNRMALLYDRMGDGERAEKYYREAAEHSSCGSAYFNLALKLHKQNRLSEAKDCIDRAIQRQPIGPYFTLAAMIAQSAGDRRGFESHLQQAFTRYPPVQMQDDWTLGWYVTAASLAGDSVRLNEGRAEQKRRKQQSKAAPPEEAPLPILAEALVRRREI